MSRSIATCRAVVASATATLLAAATVISDAHTATTPTPTLVSALPCFSPLTNSELTGEGWTPGGQVRLRGRYVSGTSGEALDVTVVADAAGRIKFNSSVPDESALRVGVEVTAEDVVRVAAGAPVHERQARTRFTLSWHGPFYRRWNTEGPARGRPGRVGTLEASGYIDDVTSVLYAHYLRVGRSGFRTVRVGRLRGPCGSLRVRFREFDFRPVPRGTYRVFFDTLPVASDNTFDSPGYRRVVVR